MVVLFVESSLKERVTLKQMRVHLLKVKKKKQGSVIFLFNYLTVFEH